MACPAAITTCIGEHRGLCLSSSEKSSKVGTRTWQNILVGSASLVQSSPFNIGTYRPILVSSFRNGRAVRDVKVCASEVRQAPGPTTAMVSAVPTHKVIVHDRQRGLVHEFTVPEDQYILHTAESQDIRLPFACRHGCCTSCAVRIKSGQIKQPEALGISAELKDKGYALLCVGFPSSDVEVETQDEDEAKHIF